MRTTLSPPVSRVFFLLCLTVTVTLAGFAYQSSQADDKFKKPSRNDRTVSRLVATLMQRDHLSSRELDDSVSKRAFDMYIKTLDPMKVYFLQDDVNEFSKKFRNKIDENMKRGDYEIAFEIFKRFLQRLDERVEDAVKLVDYKFDYTLDEEISTDTDLVQFAKTAEEMHERWRKRIKYNLMVLENDKESKKDPKEKLRKRYTAFANRMHRTDNSDVVEMYVSAITTCFDPHTTYMSSKTYENFLIQMKLELEGIGATLQETDDGYTIIKRIVVGGAADKQGDLKVDDKIVAVAQGKDGEMVDVTGMKLDDVVEKIRGNAGTLVRLNIFSENTNVTKTINIVREKIKLEDSAARGVVFEQGKKADGSPFKIGVVDLPSFYADMGPRSRSSERRSTTRDVAKILNDFKAKGVDSVVVDLRRNGGGSLREAIDCTGLFINTGPVVQVKDAYGRIQKHNDTVPGMGWNGPLVVMTSKFSASASEILAGAVQDYKRGIVVGDSTTHGKGTVQSLVGLDQLVYGGATDAPSEFGALKITMQQFYRPNGDSTQKRGVLSDVVLPSVTDHMDVTESDLDYPVEFDQVPTARFSKFGYAPKDLLKSLREQSQSRVLLSEKFQKETEKIGAYVEQKKRKAATLNREEFLARRAKFNAEKEDEKTIESQINPDTEIKRDFYMDEVLQITVDYMQALGKKKLAKK